MARSDIHVDHCSGLLLWFILISSIGATYRTLFALFRLRGEVKWSYGYVKELNKLSRSHLFFFCNHIMQHHLFPVICARYFMRKIYARMMSLFLLGRQTSSR
jgi:hypothetical protein